MNPWTNLFAVCLVNFSTFDSFGATITAIIVTAFVVVIVIAHTVFLTRNKELCGFNYKQTKLVLYGGLGTYNVNYV